MTVIDLQKKNGAPDLAEWRRKYPLTVGRFGSLREREMWLQRIWELETRWHESLEAGAKRSRAEEVLIEENNSRHREIEATFDVIYAGGVLGLLHAAVMARVHGRRVMVFDSHVVGKTHRDWNISDDELLEFERAGLFTRAELEAAIVNRYDGGFVKFHDKESKVKAAPLWMRNVLDVALDADKLLSLAKEKIETAKTFETDEDNGNKGSNNNLLADNLRFVRAFTESSRVVIETVDERAGGRQRFFAARVFVDATGTNSPVSRQLNNQVSITHVCPTVGTLARGFKRASRHQEPDAVDFSVGEILVSTEDASDHRQLIWEGFAGSAAQDEYTTYLFFYDAVESKADKSLLALFERYFESLPAYKSATNNFQVCKPVFGYIPSFHGRGKMNRKRTAANRILTIGDAAGLSSPLTFCGFGSHVRNLRRTTSALDERLKADALDENSLGDINAYESRVAQMASLAEFMRPTQNGKPEAVNETMNAVMAALHGLDERVRRELFQDRMTFDALKSLLAKTAQIYPAIFKRLKEHLGARGTFWWMAGIIEARRNEKKADD